MKYKTLKKSDTEYAALLDKVLSAHTSPMPQGRLSMQIVAVTGDFEPTQCIAEARWLLSSHETGHNLVMIDAVGDMITIIPE